MRSEKVNLARDSWYFIHYTYMCTVVPSMMLYGKLRQECRESLRHKILCAKGDFHQIHAGISCQREQILSQKSEDLIKSTVLIVKPNVLVFILLCYCPVQP